MQVFISPDDDRRAGACAPLTQGVRKPVAASTDSGDASNGEPSGGAIHHQRTFKGRTHQPGTGFACGPLQSCRPWSTALAADNNEGYRRELWPTARPAVTALTFKRLIRGNRSTNRRRTDATATNG
jgi:hypothetical protein